MDILYQIGLYLLIFAGAIIASFAMAGAVAVGLIILCFLFWAFLSNWKRSLISLAITISLGLLFIGINHALGHGH